LEPERELSSPVQTSLWPVALIGILVSSVALSVWLKSKAPQHKIAKPVAPQDHTGNESTGSPKQSAPIANVMPTPPSPDKADKCRYSHSPWWKTGAELVGIMAVVAYTILTYCLWSTAQRQLEVTERPWLKINFTAEPVTFQDGSMQFSMHANITNVGHSVATGVVVPIKMFLASNANDIFTEPLKRQKEFCDAIANKLVSAQQNETQIAIFPNSTDNSLLLGSGFSKAEIEAAPTVMPKLSGKHILPIVVGCVDYQYGVSRHHHQTRFIYEVQRFDPATPPHIFSIEVGKDVPMPNVALVPYPFGGFLAN